MQKAERILTIFLRLYNGEWLTPKRLETEYGACEKTIREDFKFLTNFIEDTSYFSGTLEKDFSHIPHRRYLKRKSQFSKKEILVMSKILLETRALNRDELSNLIDGMLNFLTEIDRKEVKEIIASEKLNYADLTNKQNRIDKIWEFSDFIRQKETVTLLYHSPTLATWKKHTVIFEALYFDDHYFYLKGQDKETNKKLDFRLDRIKEWSVSVEKMPAINYRDKFRDGDVRALKTDAFSGENITLKILYTYIDEVIIDKFPQAKIIERTKDGTIFEIEVQNTFGLKRYLISQLDALVVLSPQSLVDDIKKMLKKMQEKYSL